MMEKYFFVASRPGVCQKEGERKRMADEPRRIPTAVLLRKALGGNSKTVMKAKDFPFRFVYDGKSYVIWKTRRGGLVLLADTIQ